MLALVEGQMELRVLPEILRQLGKRELTSQLVLNNARGGNRFWEIAARYNVAAKFQTIVGLADLEQEPCASELLKEKLKGERSARFHLRLAVRMVESWIMADRQAFAAFLGISQALIPTAPDEQEHPKRALVALAGRSRRKWIREALVPDGSGAAVGPEYVPVLADFVESTWKLVEARQSSPSLERACLSWAAL